MASGSSMCRRAIMTINLMSGTALKSWCEWGYLQMQSMEPYDSCRDLTALFYKEKWMAIVPIKEHLPRLVAARGNSFFVHLTDDARSSGLFFDIHSLRGTIA
mmetsp:Transcript_31864/g.62732  ORF Transcript_31864/g.62732 Transcript_31864/m.62732 type:complete len:102 (-) Transcript_31864:19-324(-)